MTSLMCCCREIVVCDFVYTTVFLYATYFELFYSFTCRLVGNPACDQHDDLSYCKIPQLSAPPYSTPQNCVPVACASDQNLSPNCSCAYPYTGTLYFRSPSYSDLQNTTYYHILERELKASFLKKVPVDSVSLNNSFVNSFNNLEMNLQVFPSGKTRFSEVDVSTLGSMLSNQIFKPPSKIFGPFYFIGQAYPAAPGNFGYSTTLRLLMKTVDGILNYLFLYK